MDLVQWHVSKIGRTFNPASRCLDVWHWSVLNCVRSSFCSHNSLSMEVQ
jgi:hypothetical protein